MFSQGNMAQNGSANGGAATNGENGAAGIDEGLYSRQDFFIILSYLIDCFI